MPYQSRRQRLRKLLPDCDALLITNEMNVRYLTGFTGDSTYLIVLQGKADEVLLISDPRYEQQISEQCPGLNTFIRKPSKLLMDAACEQLERLKPGSVMIEAGSLSVSQFDRLSEVKNVRWVKGTAEVEKLRAVKDQAEIAKICRAVEIAQRAFLSLRAQLRARQTEREFAFEMENTIRRLGGEGCSFKPIVAVGPRAALPHAEPGDACIADSSFVLVDWGAMVDGYRSDLTRVLLTSKIPAKISKAYEAVLAAQSAAIAAVRPGVLTSEVDAAARAVLDEYGITKRFNHGLGHGIGLDIHEMPRLGKNGGVPLQEGMVVTIEPGVYYPGVGGIRIEDDILVTAKGAEVLSNLPREMQSNCVDLLG